MLTPFLARRRYVLQHSRAVLRYFSDSTDDDQGNNVDQGTNDTNDQDGKDDSWPVPWEIKTKQDAEAFADYILRQSKVDEVYGCDTEVDIDLKEMSPVGNGRVTCVSVFPCDPSSKKVAWFDVLDGDPEVLNTVKKFMESSKTKKAWHNYGFDRHVLYNHGINAKGFQGDTMHMARLVDSSLDKITGGGEGYSLKSCVSRFTQLKQGKTEMKELFAVPVSANSKVKKLPFMTDLQRCHDTRDRWIKYSCTDAIVTHLLYQKLRDRLQAMKWEIPSFEPGLQGDIFTFMMTNQKTVKNMFEMYNSLIRPFGEVLTDIEREGFKLNIEHLKSIEQQAEDDKQQKLAEFYDWLVTCGAFENEEDARAFNPGSVQQKQFLFFAIDGMLNPDPTITKKAAKQLTAAQYKNAPDPRKSAIFKAENTINFIEEGAKKAKKYRDVRVKGLGLKPSEYTASGWPSTSSNVLKALAGDPDGDPPKFGSAKRKIGEDGCRAIAKLGHSGFVDRLLNTFIIPLQRRVDNDNRIHCSLNLNTETGRLSSRSPNLQNQPALEKDIYKIRRAFCAERGKKLIVADYGQLELRVLAHLAKCTSMIKAFQDGGDFHSRTAMGMYDYIAEEEKAGKVILEWDYANGPKPEDIPMIKDKYASERRKAKVLNFSIAYGKTVVGLAKDFGVSNKEAKETLEKWYNDRPEVLEWQERTKSFARTKGYVLTIWGRRRLLPEINSRDFGKVAGAERAAINTPVQGSAADIVMGAMLRIAQNTRLQVLGWKMVLQVHDEIILEGPEESAQEALEIVQADMGNPVGFEHENFLVALETDAKIADNWYEAK